MPRRKNLDLTNPIIPKLTFNRFVVITLVGVLLILTILLWQESKASSGSRRCPVGYTVKTYGCYLGAPPLY